MRIFRSLRDIFFKSAAAACLLTSASGCATLRGSDNNGSRDGSPLDEKEAALAVTFFGPAFNASIVRKHFRDLDDKRRVGGCAATVTGPKHVYFFGDYYFARDSLHDNVGTFGVFMHEMTHIWQYQAQMPRGGDTGYIYKFTPDKSFDDYGIEQQGAIIEDYARRFLYDGKYKVSRWIQSTPANDSLLIKLVETKFPGAAKLRLASIKQKPTTGYKP